MILEENWAVSAQRVRDFFSEQDDVVSTADGFSFHDCVITVTPLPRQPGFFSADRSIVRFDGPEPQVRAIHQRFFLRFLSAGG